MKALKSVGAVLAGLVVNVILSLGTDMLMHLVAGFPSLGQKYNDQQLMVATAYRAIYGVVSSYVTARLAPDRPLQHALAGGVLGLILGTIGAVEAWNQVEKFGPHWYPVALIVLALPCAWLGGILYKGKQPSR